MRLNTAAHEREVQAIHFLQSIPVFGNLQGPCLPLLTSSMEHVDLPAGAVLFRQGEPGDAVYIVRSGTLQVVVTLSNGDSQPLAVLAPGDLIGEMAVLYGRPRAATVQAVTAATLLKVHASTIEQLFALDPSIRAQFLDVASRRLPSLHLASVPIFAGIDSEAMRELDQESNWVRIAGGQTLFKQGDRSDYLYVIVLGRLEVILEREDGHRDIVRQLGHGEVVGEVGLLSGEPRTATVRAIRDSELVRLSKEDLHRFIERHPRGAIEMLRILAGRVRPVAPARCGLRVSTIAVIPTGRHRLPRGWIERLVEALGRIGGPTLYLNRSRMDEELGDTTASSLGDEVSRIRIASWLREQEYRFRYIVSECDPAHSTWTDLCLRHADLVLFVACAQGDPCAGELEHRILSGKALTSSTTRELVLLHPQGTSMPVGTARWLSVFPVARHHHVRIGRAEDHDRLARSIAGKAVGLAVSGGGARAFAHVGVIRALRESGVPIDSVAGVSAGSFAAAFCAMGHDIDTIIEICRRYMGQYKFLRDATLPMVAFLSGRKYVRLLRRIFGDIGIEDLWLPLFCLSANLSTAKLVVHDRGPLWMGIRATTSVPGIEPPVCVDGELLVDGGVLNNLPADVVRSRGNGTVIASDASLPVDLKTDAREQVAISGWPLFWARLNPFTEKPPLPHIFEILMRTATLSSIRHGASVAQCSDLYLCPPVEGVPTFDWSAGTVLVERAYRYALPQIEKWKDEGGFPQ